MSVSADRFKDKVVIVTGAASGIGLATARRFAQEGATLALGDINKEELDERIAEFGLPQERVLTARLDVGDPEAAEAFVLSVAERFGGLDVLANVAGVGLFGYVTEVSVEQWTRVVNTSLNSIFYMSRKAIPLLAERGGNVVNMASVSGLFGDYGFAGYNAAKGGVINLTRSMAVSHGHQGVRVNVVCPGFTITPASKWMWSDPGIMGEWERLTPLGRGALPEEVAAAVAFLASGDATFITGHALVVDGGVSAATGGPNYKRLAPDRKPQPPRT